MKGVRNTPRVNLGKVDYEKKFGAIIKSSITRAGMQIKDMEKVSGNSKSTLSSRFKSPGKMPISELKIFIKATGLSKDDVIDYLYEGK